MKRRTFFLGAAAAAAVTAASGAAMMLGKDEDTIAMVLHARLPYLTLDPEGVRKFSADLAGLHVVSGARMKLLRLIRPIYQRFELSAGENALAYKLRHGEERIVSLYLLASDFFINGADESRTVRYLGLLDSTRACGNPFARLVF
jgi:hypothetical protein